MKLQLCLLLSFFFFGVFDAKSTNLTQSAPITLSVYYESLCPFSKKFFCEQLIPVYRKFGNQVKYELIPSGHTFKLNPSDTFRCQHGPEECYRNKVQGCQVSNGKDLKQTLNFIICMFDNYKDRGQSQRCAQKFGINWSSLSDCVSGLQGESLERGNKAKTDEYNPEKIPFVLQNNRVISKYCLEENLLSCLEH